MDQKNVKESPIIKCYSCSTERETDFCNAKKYCVLFKSNIMKLLDTLYI